MPFLPNSSLYLKKLSSEYQLYACGNFFSKSSILKEIAILGQPPRLFLFLLLEYKYANYIKKKSLKEI